MKNINILVLIYLIFSFSSCQEDIDIPITNQEIKIETNQATQITSVSAKSGGRIPEIIGALPILSRGVCWGANPTPTIISNGFSVDGQGTGDFDSYIQGLNPSTKYYYRSYASNEKETVYGAVKNFTTLSQNPIVTTVSATSITESSAKLNATISAGTEAITTRGFEYRLTSASSWTRVTITQTTSAITHLLTGLTANTAYTYRAYATTVLGTVYGTAKTFKTLSKTPPTVITNPATSITKISATLNATISAGAEAITTKGFEFKLTSASSWTKVTITQTTSVISHLLIGLTANTAYTYRAYATTVSGTVYGALKSFTTLSLSQNPIVTTVSATQTGSNYSSSGFDYDGTHYNYNYEYYCKFEFRYENTQYAEEIGFSIDGDSYHFTTKEDGLKNPEWIFFSNSNNTTITYQAYAKKYDGSYIYGVEKSVYLYYGGKNNNPQKKYLDLSIDESTPVRKNIKKQSDNNNKISTAVQRKN
ncbi:MAG: hypothetical protein WC135_02400 [Bacteroidales bacterium]